MKAFVKRHEKRDVLSLSVFLLYARVMILSSYVSGLSFAYLRFKVEVV